MITDITHQMAHNAAYLVKVSQKDSNNIQMQKIKTVLSGMRLATGLTMGYAIFTFSISVLQLKSNGLASKTVLFVAAFELFKFLQGREKILDNPIKTGVKSFAQGLLNGLKNLNVEKGVKKGLKHACKQQVEGTLFAPLWIELQMKMLKNGYNPFPYSLD